MIVPKYNVQSSAYLLNLLPGIIGLRSEAATITAAGPRTEPCITLAFYIRESR